MRHGCITEAGTRTITGASETDLARADGAGADGGEGISEPVSEIWSVSKS